MTPLAISPILLRVLETLPLGVIVLDRVGKVVLFNEYEERLARRSREQVIGRDFFHEVAPCMNVRELGGRFRSEIDSTPIHVRTEFQVDFPFNDHPRDVVVQLDTLVIDGAPYGCLLVEDVSAKRAVDRMRESLTDLLLHDLKSPLSTIMANVSYVRDNEKLRTDTSALEALDDAAAASERLQSMLLNLLDLTRLQTGTFPLKRRPVILRDLLEITAQAMVGPARDRGVSIAIEGKETEARVDPDILRRAVDNLVENALRYSPRGGRVTLRVDSDDEHFTLSVVDQGPGLDDLQRERIFDRFHTTGDPSRNRGLGLSFVQLAARAHGGEAAVDDPGVGSIFRVSGLLDDALQK